MAIVAGTLRIDDVASQSDEVTILVFKIEMNGGNSKTDLNFLVISVAVIFPVAVPRGNATYHRTNKKNSTHNPDDRFESFGR